MLHIYKPSYMEAGRTKTNKKGGYLYSVVLAFHKNDYFWDQAFLVFLLLIVFLGLFNPKTYPYLEKNGAIIFYLVKENEYHYMSMKEKYGN